VRHSLFTESVDALSISLNEMAQLTALVCWHVLKEDDTPPVSAVMPRLDRAQFRMPLLETSTSKLEDE